MSESEKFDELREQLEAELHKWHTKIEEARVQMNLGTMEAADRLRPVIEELEKELAHAKEKWNELEVASGKSWVDIKEGLDVSVDAMKQAFGKAREHFKSGAGD
jgi:predicted  nucleic acid-binding Zn-ribbon protein